MSNGARAEIFFFTKPQIGSGSGSVAMYRSTSSTIFCNSREREARIEICLSVCLQTIYLRVVMNDDEKKSDEFFFFLFFEKNRLIESLESWSLFFCSLSLFPQVSLLDFFSFLLA